MAFIKIIQMPNGYAAGRGYTFKQRTKQHEVCKIRPGEVAEIPDEDLDWHLSKGVVQQCKGPSTVEQDEVVHAVREHKRGRGKRGDNNRGKPIPDVPMHNVPDAVRAFTGLGTGDR